MAAMQLNSTPIITLDTVLMIILQSVSMNIKQNYYYYYCFLENLYT